MEGRTRTFAGATQILAAGAAVGILGGLIGLGGAEFRLPLLIGVFGFAALNAVILNKAMSLVVVLTALPVRLLNIPYADLQPHWNVVINLLAGSLIGAWLGAGVATRMNTATLHRVLGGLLAAIAVILVATHTFDLDGLGITGSAQVIVGVLAGLGIGLVASVMGVAGGELLIPAIVLIYGVDIKIAGSLSLMVSLPTMIIAFTRYSRDNSFVILKQQHRFVWLMAAGSIAGTIIGGLLVRVVPDAVLIPALGLVLLISAVKVWREA